MYAADIQQVRGQARCMSAFSCIINRFADQEEAAGKRTDCPRATDCASCTRENKANIANAGMNKIC